jgi:hypothetical protein
VPNPPNRPLLSTQFSFSSNSYSTTTTNNYDINDKNINFSIPYNTSSSNNSINIVNSSKRSCNILNGGLAVNDPIQRPTSKIFNFFLLFLLTTL